MAGPSASSSDILIRIRSLAKTYSQGSITVPALRGIDLDVPRGEYLAIMGPSGSGKSTLMNLLGLMDKPTSGEFLLNGIDISALADDDELSRIRGVEIGFVFQNFNLLARQTALENVELPLIYQGASAQDRSARASEALRTVGLPDRMDHRPGELSGGQKQRVAVARALVTKPSLLLADEPTGNLDSRTGTEILELFDSLHGKGNTLVVVTHDARVAARAQRVLHLKDGLVERLEIPGQGPAGGIAG